MNTLEMMLKDLYEDEGFLYNESMLSAAAEYIEMYNANKAKDERTLTPYRWFSDSKRTCPESFVREDDLYCKVADYLIEQRKLCIDQTGCQPCYEDWKQEFESDDFRETIGEWVDTITITKFLNWLLTVYNSYFENV